MPCNIPEDSLYKKDMGARTKTLFCGCDFFEPLEEPILPMFSAQ